MNDKQAHDLLGALSAARRSINWAMTVAEQSDSYGLQEDLAGLNLNLTWLIDDVIRRGERTKKGRAPRTYL